MMMCSVHRLMARVRFVGCRPSLLPIRSSRLSCASNRNAVIPLCWSAIRSAARAFSSVCPFVSFHRWLQWLGKKGAIDNSYESTFGQNGWGFRAQQVLGAVRGK